MDQQSSETDLVLADVFGRVEVILVSIFFYVLGTLLHVEIGKVLRAILTTTGTIVEAVSGNVESFSAGAVFYQVWAHFIKQSPYGILTVYRLATQP